MPGANKATTPVAVDLPEIEGRYASAGDYTIGFESYPEDVDPTPYFRGLPDDRCQCPHWGLVTAGEVTFRYADELETFRAGDAYYARPGHLPLLKAGTELVEFSPTLELDCTMRVLRDNLAAVMPS